MGSLRINNFQILSRQNTGSHLLDSGSIYGYHYQRELPTRLIEVEISEYSDGKQELNPTISLGLFLDAIGSIDEEQLRKFRRFANRKDQRELSHWENIHNYAEYLGMDVVVDYTYNWENDLSQNFQFFALTPKGERDWLYSDERILFIQTHNGCDARGGFSEPVPMEIDETTKLLDVVVGWRFVEGIDSKGAELSEEQLRELDEEFQIGYESSPTYQLNSKLREILEVNKDEVALILKSGEVVIAYPYSNAEY